MVAETRNLLLCFLRGRVGLGVMCFQYSFSPFPTLAWSWSILHHPLPRHLPGASETEPEVGRGLGLICRWQVGTLELSVPEQSWAFTLWQDSVAQACKLGKEEFP